MDRQYYLDLASSRLRMPIGADLVLHECPDAEQIVLDGRRLGEIVESTARRYHTPLAIPLMDLRLEKADLLGVLGLTSVDPDSFHFSQPPAEDLPDRDAPFGQANQAQFDAIRYVRGAGLVPVGMSIGPFSLTTKLIADPIASIAMAGMGVTAEEDAGVQMVERCLRLAEFAIERSLRAQIAAGAAAVLVCEPAANVVYLSPRQLAAGSDIFERLVIQPNLRLKRQLSEAGVDLIFHDCGELNDFMVREFSTRLDPAILSLGSSRQLWEDAALVPKHVVLFGNLPTKSFYSDTAMPVEKVESLTLELIERMRAAAHPHILGSECDVLHVPDAAATIRRKVDVMLTCSRTREFSTSLDSHGSTAS
jgi:uroporphyrinogen-III decarboxylase